MDDKEFEELCAQAKCIKRKYEQIEFLDFEITSKKKEKERTLETLKKDADYIKEINRKMLNYQNKKRLLIEEIAIIINDCKGEINGYFRSGKSYDG